MLTINPTLFVGKGLDRECYIHPQDSNRCVKITTSGDYTQSQDEIKIYGRLLKRNISWHHLARYYGAVQTDKGLGLVFDLVRDYDGAISQGLSSCSASVGRSVIERALTDLKTYLLHEKILVRDLNAENMLFRKDADGSGRLLIVDGVGNNDYIPVADYIAWWATKKIERKWQRFEYKYHKLLFGKAS
jgi:PhoP regulatory network protein YrbL